MAKIGLYVYRLSLRRTDNYQEVPFSLIGIGGSLRTFLQTFIQNKQQPQQNQDAERSWVLEPRPDNGHAKEGLVQYGTFGIASNIRDPQTRAVKLVRAAGDVEEIPLYYQFWVPPNGMYGFAVLQSYRDRSCVQQVLNPLVKEFNDLQDDVRLNAQKIMPTDDAAYQNAPVQKLLLVKRRISRDRADVLRDLPPEEYKIELSLTPRRRGGIGSLLGVAPIVRGAAQGAAIMVEGIEFEEASALVKVGSAYKKVSIIGPSNNAGVIDVTEDVAFDGNGHPTFQSVASVATQTVVDFRQAYGLN
jgi:hypothetical protein